MSDKPNVTIRRARLADIPAIASLHNESWANTYRGLVPDSFLDNLRYEDRVRRWEERFTDPAEEEFVYVAQDAAERILGFASGGPERTEHPLYKGELRALHVSPAYHSQGIGRRLTSAVAGRLVIMGMNSMLLWVLVGNPACGFYEALGGQNIDARQEEVPGGFVDEIAYGWVDTRSLIINDAALDDLTDQE
ncbi:MAG TPA: GNAT family N-acetyltransferase [Chloroflexia bacterium]|nr:GNAT family N-acetyltransferase [Chloroflexia bacterium]